MSQDYVEVPPAAPRYVPDEVPAKYIPDDIKAVVKGVSEPKVTVKVKEDSKTRRQRKQQEADAKTLVTREEARYIMQAVMEQYYQSFIAPRFLNLNVALIAIRDILADAEIITLESFDEACSKVVKSMTEIAQQEGNNGQTASNQEEEN